MMGQMLGPEGLYLLAKELQPRPRRTPRPAGGSGSGLRVRLGSALIAAGTAIGGERLHGRATSPTA